MIETSLISLREAANNGMTLKKDMSVVLPLVGEAVIYGFTAVHCEKFSAFFSDKIDTPPLQQSLVLSNRVVVVYQDHVFKFPIFSQLEKNRVDRCNVYGLYIPKVLKMYGSDTYKKDCYIKSLREVVPHSGIRSLLGFTIDDGVAYYHPDADEFMFTSSSEMRGIGNDFTVITRRISQETGSWVYEVYDPDEVKIDGEISKEKIYEAMLGL